MEDQEDWEEATLRKNAHAPPSRARSARYSDGLGDSSHSVRGAVAFNSGSTRSRSRR